jgi:hypothetical protein
MSNRIVAAVVVVLLGVAFAVGRSSAPDESSGPQLLQPLTPSPSQVVNVERVYVDRIPALCAAAVSLAKFTYDDLTDPQFVYDYKWFLRLSTDTQAWLAAAKDLAFKAHSIELGFEQLPGPASRSPGVTGAGSIRTSRNRLMPLLLPVGGHNGRTTQEDSGPHTALDMHESNEAE